MQNWANLAIFCNALQCFAAGFCFVKSEFGETLVYKDAFMFIAAAASGSFYIMSSAALGLQIHRKGAGGAPGSFAFFEFRC